MGSQTFENVRVPLLWGTRAVVQDKKGRLSIINLMGNTASVEVLSDAPAPGVKFQPRTNGFVLIDASGELYSYDPANKVLESVSLNLPTCRISPTEIAVGGNRISNSFISGSAVGIHVREGGGMGIGAQFPPGLAKLVV
jgi:hypothetical protein